MKKLVIVFVIIILCSFIYCQTVPDWLWAQNAGGMGNDEGLAIATDNLGNSYLTGYFSGTATFGTTTLTSNGESDIFITKLDNTGNYQWAKKAGGIGEDIGYGIASDSSGDCYLTGTFSDTAVFGTTSLTSSGDHDIFIAKLDSAGNYLWAKKAGGTSWDQGCAITTDSNGICYVTGLFQGSATFDTTTLISAAASDVFIAKMDTSGNYLCVKQANGTWNEIGNSISIDNIGNIYVTGWFDDTATFGTTTLTSSGYSDIFIAKLDSNCDFLWATKAGGPNMDEGYSIAVDNNGNCYVTGYFYVFAYFDSTLLNGDGFGDIFIAKLDSNGNYVWVRKAGGYGWEEGSSVFTDNNGNSLVTGYFGYNATFGTTTLTNDGGSDVFITKLDENGNFIWAKQAGGMGSVDVLGYSISADNFGNSSVTGCFNGTATFGTTTLSSSGESDIFIAKLASDGTFITDELSPPATGHSHLSNAYPNPLHKGANSIIKAEIPLSETGLFTIYNFRGQIVQSHKFTSGSHEISFSGKDLAPGIYFYQLKTTTVNEVKKLILLR